MRTKYNAKKTVVDGIKFDSKKEAARYSQLKAMEQAGEISGLTRQKRYELTPGYKEADYRDIKGKCHKGRVIERPSYYVADFVYEDSKGQTIVEDCKGYRTDVYKLKRKMMLYRYGIRILET
ncbi:MAG: DUF1064 domain-containing protein [Lachnospiraceae bacterium]|nr:DUF1064 domain-containing protein [Lachnospiraceae bacterium]